MSDLVEFLRARVGEDAAEIANHPDEAESPDDWAILALAGDGSWPYSPYFPLLTIGKKRALAEVELKRQIIVEHEIVVDGIDEGEVDPASATEPAHTPRFGCRTCHVDDRHIYDGGYCVTLQALARPYAGHAAYREEWQP